MYLPFVVFQDDLAAHVPYVILEQRLFKSKCCGYHCCLKFVETLPCLVLMIT